MDINISSQIVVQTAAQWAADNTVYSAKRILVTSDAYYGSTDQRKFKIADGVQTWAQLDYMPIAQTLAQVLANGSSTNAISFKSPDSQTELLIANNNIDSYVDDGNTISEINITPTTINISTTGTSATLNAPTIYIDAPTINLPQSTASRIVETDASKNLTYAAKNTAYNKDFGTGTTNIVEIGSTLGNSLITSTDANGKLQTLTTATYPSLTELSYVKGVTSAIQTQLNGKRSTTNDMLLWTGQVGAINLADSITYYLGDITGLTIGAGANLNRFQFPQNYTLTKVLITWQQTANPTNEQIAFYLRANNTTDQTITTSLDASLVGANTSKVYSYTGLNLSITSGTDYEIKMVTPAWSTNPTNVRLSIKFYGY